MSMKEYDLAFITEQDFYGDPVYLRNADSGAFYFPPMLWTIGDSHTQYLEQIPVDRKEGPQLPKLVHRHPFSNGAPTAWRLTEEGSTSHGRERLFSALRYLRPKDQMLLSYGEIDARQQIPRRHLREGVPLESCVDETMERYSKVLMEIQECGLGDRIIIHGIPPLSPVMLERNLPGEWDVRVEAFRLFNEHLRAYCMRGGFPSLT